MWLPLGEIDLGKLPFLEHKIYKYWLTCVKLGLFDGAMVLVQLSVIIGELGQLSWVIYFLFIMKDMKDMKDEWVNVRGNFYL